MLDLGVVCRELLSAKLAAVGIAGAGEKAPADVFEIITPRHKKPPKSFFDKTHYSEKLSKSQ